MSARQPGRYGWASPRSWRTVLRDALLAGEITSAQHDVVLRGLGDPPSGDEGVRRSDADAWTAAATRLVRESAARTVEDLAQAARCIRDLLDPAGAERRFDERHAARSFRIWRDQDGVQRGSFRFDDEGAAWTVAVLDAALRPRRGGPRFVDPAEKAEAEHLIADPRTNEQLQYDLIIDLLRAGTLADSTIVFGTRQAGVRVVVTADAIDSARQGRPGVAVLEDTHQAVPTAFAVRHACGTGVAECTLDRDGNPLYQGREARLFTPKQGVALTIRDGGCRWIGCDRPASYGEAHHIDEYAHGGKTDIDRGILLCRFHHMELHHGGWRITRDRLDDFVLHPPPGRGSPIPLRPPVERRYAWGDLRPPPTRFPGRRVNTDARTHGHIDARTSRVPHGGAAYRTSRHDQATDRLTVG